MNFTRQDLQKISNYLSRLSVKDSQFKKLDNVAGSDLLTMLHDGKNVTATVASLLSYVQDNISLASIPVSISGLSSTTLLGVLNELKSVKENGGNMPDVYHYYFESPDVGNGVRYYNVGDALLYIFGVLLGVIESPIAADDNEIKNIINN